MPEVNFAKARQLCTPLEWRLVEGSRPQAIRTLTEPQLKSRIARARGLRDQWQDVFTRQRRDAQRDRNTRDVAAHDRSQQKGELFGAVLGRFEAQLEKGGAGAGTGRQTTGARTPPSKETRGRQDRRTLARGRQDLAEQLSAWESEGGSVRGPAERSAMRNVATPATGSRPKGTDTPPPARSSAGAKKKTKKSTRKKTAAARQARDLAPGGAAGQRRSQPVTGRDRILASGPARRARGHALGGGQRSQARRDRRR